MRRLFALAVFGACRLAGGCTGRRERLDPSRRAADDDADTLILPGANRPERRRPPGGGGRRLVEEIPSDDRGRARPDQLTCIADGLIEAVDVERCERLGLAGVVVEQPFEVQAAIFGVFDGCVDPGEYGRVAAPILGLAGVAVGPAECVFT